MRDWCAILIDAALRDLRPIDIAKEQGVSPSTTSIQAKRHGLLLRGARPVCASPTPLRRSLRPQDWQAEIAYAAIRRETLNQFCTRVGVSGAMATRQAAKRGHTFPRRDRTQTWRALLAQAEAAQETLNAFCRRTGKNPSTALAWARRLGHAFPPGPSMRSKAAKGRKAPQGAHHAA